MASVFVCSLARLDETVAATGARDMVTLINVGTPVERPSGIEAGRHLTIGLSDIVEPLEGHVLPDETHVRALLDFVRGWDRADALVIHCFAGISRSTAAAYLTACALAPERDEGEIADALRAASAFATPNPLIVAIGDRLLARDGRMTRAIGRIGRGREAFEGEPFCIELA